MDSLKKSSRFVRFSLRGFIGCCAVAAACIAFIANRAHDQRLTVNELMRHGAKAYYSRKTSDQVRESDFWHHFVFQVKTLELRPIINADADSQIILASKLRGVEILAIHPGRTNESGLNKNALGGMTDKGAHAIAARFNSIKELYAYAAKCSDVGLRQLENSLHHAERIQISLAGGDPEKGLFVNCGPSIKNKTRNINTLDRSR